MTASPSPPAPSGLSFPKQRQRPQMVCACYAFLAAVLALLWQASTVHFNYGGNWTALFCTGDRQNVPPQLAANTYLFMLSQGYDGQFYRYVAHDPLLRKGLRQFMDAPSLRYRRILVPGLAFLMAGGQSQFIDAAYLAVILLFVFLGSYWLSRYAAFHGRHPAWGIGFIFVPATLISINRLTVDVALVALCAGFAWYAKKGSPARLCLVLALGPPGTGDRVAPGGRRWPRCTLESPVPPGCFIRRHVIAGLALDRLCARSFPRPRAGRGATRCPAVGVRLSRDRHCVEAV
jgi:hypothetical protein